MEIEKKGREEITGKAILFRATNEKALLITIIIIKYENFCMTIIILLFRIWRCTDYNNIPKIANPDLPRSQVKYEYLFFVA